MTIQLLIVDDESAILSILSSHFRSAGLEVECALSGQEALEKAEQHKPLVVLSDLRMPHMNGVQLFEALRAKGITAPFALMTGYTTFSLNELYDKGIDAVFTKPLDLPNVVLFVLSGVSGEAPSWKRRDLRVLVSLPAAAELRGEGIALDAGRIEGKVSNIGYNGLFMECEGPLPPEGAKVPFEIRFLDATPRIKGVGVCRWKRGETETEKTAKRGFGLEIIEMDADSRAHLNRIVGQLAWPGPL